MRNQRVLLASDMDGTVIPMEITARRKTELASFRKAVEAAPALHLAYVTGRDLRLSLKGIEQHRLPDPEILVCDVGTSVYIATPEGFEKDTEYVRVLEEARGGLDVRDVHQQLTHLPELLLQAQEKQTESKLSYYLAEGSEHTWVVEAVREVLAGLGGGIQAVYSVGAPHGTGLLDLLPAGVAKDFALRYLHRKVGVEASEVIYAGDSGNDLAALLSGYKAIVVGNATAGLKEELRSRGGERRILHQLYFAEDSFASGVLEGCRHFGVL